MKSQGMNDGAKELYSLLVPLTQERLIVPRACVAEVVTWQQPEKIVGAPPWFLGTISWNGRTVPVISFEAACGNDLPKPGNRTRIVIFVAISGQQGGQLASGYFGLLTQGFPQLVRVSNDVVKPDPSRTFDRGQPVLCQVRFLNEAPLIPDFARLEQMIAQPLAA
jgi:chemosensory pili system protein ChpC